MEVPDANRALNTNRRFPRFGSGKTLAERIDQDLFYRKVAPARYQRNRSERAIGAYLGVVLMVRA